MKVLNKVSADGYANGNESKMPPNDATRAMAKALIAGSQESVSNIITDAKDSVLGGNISQATATIVADFNSKLAGIQSNYENAVVGTTTSTSIGSPEFLVFDESTRKSGISSSTNLTVPQQKILMEFMKNKYLSGNATIDDVKFVGKLGYITPDLNIDLLAAHFQDINLVYASMGGWKPTGNVKTFIPATAGFAGVTVESVVLYKSGTPVLTLEAEGGDGLNWRINANVSAYNFNTQIIMTAGTTTTYNLIGTLTGGKGTFSYPVTMEVINIPNVDSMYLIDGTKISSSQSNDPSLTAITPVSDKLPIIMWSTAETDAITLPAGYQWACFLEIYSYKISGGKVDSSTRTPVYASGTDLGSLITSNSFILPPGAELSQTDGSGTSIVYKIRLQRTLLGPSGKFVGWGAGSNDNYIKYVP